MTETAHASLVIVDGVGVLITGEAGAGKSECALDLITRGHCLVADDVVLIDRTSNTLTGKAPDRFAGLLEIRDIGIFDVRQVFGEDSFASESRIDLCVELKKSEAAEPSPRIGAARSETDIFGVKLPHFLLAVTRGRNLMVLVELAVRLVSMGAERAEWKLIGGHDTAVAGKS